MSKVLRYLPELQGEEQLHVAQLLRDMSEEEAEQFAHVYRQRRRDPMLTLITDLLGFFGIAGVHRFVLGQIGMGLLYLFTGGLCAIGTIIDLFNHKSLTYKYNIKQADEVALLVRSVLAEPRQPGRLTE